MKRDVTEGEKRVEECRVNGPLACAYVLFFFFSSYDRIEDVRAVYLLLNLSAV